MLLGSGDPKLEQALKDLMNLYPDQFRCEIGYNEVLAHQIEAGADLFLMPSRFEPCGLNQLYSLKYGTLPIVSRVGGLADTVIPANLKLDNLDVANGFGLEKLTLNELVTQINLAISIFNEPVQWRKMNKNAMQRDSSWTNSAKQYITVYDKACDIKTIATRKQNLLQGI